MATKKALLKEAQGAGLVDANASEADYTEAQLLAYLGRGPAYEGSKMLNKPQVAPDGHVNLSQEDIDARG